MYGEIRKCKNCGADLERWARINKETCSANCRKAWSRRKDAIEREAYQALSAVRSLRQMMKDYPDLRPLIHTKLNQIKTDVADTFFAYPDQEAKDRLDMLNGIARNRTG